MANFQHPLLEFPTRRSTHPACKLLLFSVSLAAVLSLAALVTHRLATPHHRLHLYRPAQLCASSPRPASCRAVISGGLGEGEASHSHPVNPDHVLHNILTSSMIQLEAAVSAAAGILPGFGEPRQRAALADCLELMDLSLLRLTDSASAISGGAHDDAKTWLSASLTNYHTCLNGMSGSARSDMEAHLRPLVETASAALAVLDAVSSAYDDEILRLAVKFPLWMPVRDRRHLEAASADEIEADAIVALDGSGNFTTVQAAVDSAPNKGKSRFVIYVKKGTYEQNVNVGKKKTNVMIVGDGMNDTIITGSLNVVDGSTTFNSATLAAVGDGFILQDICIQNTAGPEKHQAVALRVGADKSAINRCKIEAYQDTLYTHTLRQFYRDSTILGTVDFIFGNAAVVFQNCSLVARLPMSNQQNLVTAQGRTDPNQNTGTSVQNCRVVPSDDLAPVKGTIPSYLGRPWKQYSRTVFLQSYIDDHIDPKGWLEWSGTFALETLYYGEYANWGPGAGTAGRVNWTGYHVITDASVAESFTVAGLIQGGSWLLSTGVPFTEAL